MHENAKQIRTKLVKIAALCINQNPEPTKLELTKLIRNSKCKGKII
jgi:hypothetical protein